MFTTKTASSQNTALCQVQFLILKPTQRMWGSLCWFWLFFIWLPSHVLLACQKRHVSMLLLESKTSNSCLDCLPVLLPISTPKCNNQVLGCLLHFSLQPWKETLLPQFSSSAAFTNVAFWPLLHPMLSLELRSPPPFPPTDHKGGENPPTAYLVSLR